MKSIVKYSFAVLIMGLVSSTYGQTPEKVVIDTKDYYQHGFNSNGANTFTDGKADVKPQEVRDSVTVNSTMKYFVLPDKNYNASWYPSGNLPSNVESTTGIVSSFTWTVQPNTDGDGSATAVKHVASINWTKVGDANIKVQEAPQSATCIGNETSIPVVIIPKPTITFNQIGTPPDFKFADCYAETQVNNTITYPFPIAMTTSSSQVRVEYKITYTKEDGTPGSDILSPAGGVIVTGNTLPVGFSAYGTYKIEITKLSDRVSRKSNVTCEIADKPGESKEFTLVVMRPAQTGPIYRLPNNGNY